MSTDTGTTAPAAVPQPGTEVAQTVPEKGDFEGRLRQGGDFAVEQVKAAQREVTRLQAKYKEIDPVIDAVNGSENLLNHLRRLNTLVSNPAMRAVITEFEQTGTVPSKAAKSNGRDADADDDDFEEPWTRDLRALREENAALRADMNSVRGERGVEKVQGFFGKFFEEFPLQEDDRKTLAEALGDQAKKWSTDLQGLNVLRNLDYTTFRSLALGKLSKEQIYAIADQERLRKQGARAAAATDVPSRMRTQAQEEPTALDPKDAFIQACREVGVDPYRPLV